MTPEQMQALQRIEERMAALEQAEAVQSARNPDGTYGQPPAGVVTNPETGQMVDMGQMRQGYANNMTTGQAFGQGGRDGLAMNFNDEIAGRAQGEYERERIRAMQGAAQEAAPWAYAGGQILGTAPAAMATAPLAAAKTGLGVAGRGAALGAAEGQVWGMGQEEGSVGQRAQGALPDAAAGATVGGLAPAVVGAVGKGLGIAGDIAGGAVAGALGTPRRGKANSVIADALARSGKTKDQVASELMGAAADGQGSFTIADALGTAGRRRLNGLARSGGEASEDIIAYLEARQADQPGRVGQFLDDAMGTRGETAEAFKSRQDAIRKANNDVNYSAARNHAEPVDVRGVLSVIDERLAPMEGMGVSGDGIDSLFQKYRNRLAAPEGKLPEGASSVEMSDFDRVLNVKEDLQDDISTAFRAGANQTVARLKQIERAIDDSLEAASPHYRMANDEARASRQTIGAVDTGAALARPNVRGSDAAAQFNALRPNEQQGARVGYTNAQQARLEANAAPTANRAKPLTSQEAREKIAALSMNPDQINRRLMRENEMWKTGHQTLQGSQTANNLADMAGIESGEQAVSFVRDPMGSVSIGATLGNIADAIKPYVTGQNEATRQKIAEALLSNDPSALEPAINQVTNQAARRRLIEALMRGGAIDAEIGQQILE